MSAHNLIVVKEITHTQHSVNSALGTFGAWHTEKTRELGTLPTRHAANSALGPLGPLWQTRHSANSGKSALGSRHTLQTRHPDDPADLALSENPTNTALDKLGIHNTRQTRHSETINTQ